MNGKTMTGLLACLFLLAGPPALNAAPDHGQNKEKIKHNKKPKKVKPHDSRFGDPVFGADDRHHIRDYYRNGTGSLPPGLQKRGGNLPPGLERQLARKGTLPKGLQKRIEPFPPELNGRLPVLAPGYTRGLLGESAVIIDRRTLEIVDVIPNVLALIDQ
jgi:hypothetical protein